MGPTEPSVNILHCETTKVVVGSVALVRRILFVCLIHSKETFEKIVLHLRQTNSEGSLLCPKLIIDAFS